MRLTKHHGLRNDFLVHIAGEPSTDVVTIPQVRELCDRREGIGADGLIVGTTSADGADIRMAIFNADGSRVEMSGNGIRCLAQAEALRRAATQLELRVDTDVGLRTVSLRPSCVVGTSMATVDMGRPLRTVLGPSNAEIDMGNPHRVYRVDDPSADEHLALADPTWNTEFVAPGPEHGAITMRVIERAIGETPACGTGACAAAYAARHWGLCGDAVVVHMAGGDATVALGETITLTASVSYVGAIDVGASPAR